MKKGKGNDKQNGGGDQDRDAEHVESVKQKPLHDVGRVAIHIGGGEIALKSIIEKAIAIGFFSKKG